MANIEQVEVIVITGAISGAGTDGLIFLGIRRT